MRMHIAMTILLSLIVFGGSAQIKAWDPTLRYDIADAGISKL
jgi:hypothetical protein